MEFIVEFFKKDSTKKLLTFIALGLFFYLMRGLANLFLLTFLITYLINSLQQLILKKVKIISRRHEIILTIILYVAMLAGLVFITVNYTPLLIKQIKSIYGELKIYMKSAHHDPIEAYIVSLVKNVKLSSYLKNNTTGIVGIVSKIGSLSSSVFFAIVLSLFFMLEKNELLKFIKKFENSRASGIYKQVHYIGVKFLNSFGKVMQAQILIATSNCAISVIGLTILGFPQIVPLGFMIFFLSLIPVAGAFISLVPLALIAYKIGGLIKIVYVIILIAIIHAVETYFLNPKFMSAKTELPIFMTFLLLIVSDHFFGIWGLIVGIPIFMFILDLLNVNFTKTKKE